MRAGDLKVGSFVEIDNKVYEVVSIERQKIAQRQPHVKVKLKDTVSGKTLDRTFVSSEELKSPDVSIRKAKYVYKDADQYVFLDSESYEEYRFSEESVGEFGIWFVEDVDFDIISSNGIPITVRLPKVMEFEVTDTPPGVRGDTESGGSKPAILSNGVTIQVPLHIKKGDRVKVNPETKEYIGRT